MKRVSITLAMKSLFRSGALSFAEFVNTMREESEAQQKKVEGYMNKAIVKRKKLMKMMVISSMMFLCVM